MATAKSVDFRTSSEPAAGKLVVPSGGRSLDSCFLSRATAKAGAARDLPRAKVVMGQYILSWHMMAMTDAHIARTQFRQIMDLATKKQSALHRRPPRRAGRRDHLSVQEFIRDAAPSPDWLKKAWTGAK
jgi:hypothetical protein